MKILHICSYYNTSRVYAELINALQTKGVNQTVFVPIKRTKDIIYDGIIYSHCLRPFLKISLLLKTICVVFSLLKRYGILGLKEFDVIHCHTLFSDGFPGYIIHIITGVEYVISVRNSDYNAYLKYFYHLRYVGAKIAKNAKKIIFISVAYKNKFLSRYRGVIGDNYLVIPNGVNKYWLKDQRDFNSINTDSAINVISLGYFDKNKNFGNAISATNQLSASGYKINHYFIGGSFDEFVNVYGLIPGNKENFYGMIKDRDKIDKILRRSEILLVPSHVETFGLVYIEALSRGVRVVCSKQQGISGLIDDESLVSFCDPNSIDSIAMSIKSLVISGQHQKGVFDISMFDWKLLSSRYLTEVY